MGRLVWEKGIHELLYATKLLLAENKNIKMIIAGSGPFKKKLERFSYILGINSNVDFIGSIPYEKMPELMNSADILCLPSIPTKRWQEQFGYVLVEAMACGKPVVSTLSGSIPEIVENRKTGFLVRPADSKALADALQKLIEDDALRRKMGKAGRDLVLRKFNAVKIAKDYSKLCKSIL